MVKSFNILLSGIILVAIIPDQFLAAADVFLQCWHCSSDTIGAEDFCSTTFSESNIPTDLLKERNISVLRSCNSTINSEHERAVCRKTVEDINGKIVTKRFCYYTNKSDPFDLCSQESTEKNVRRNFCQDCITDKCNSGQQVAAIVGTLLLPIALNLF